MLRYVSNMWDSFFPHKCVFPLQIAGCPGEPIESEEQLVEHLRRRFVLFTYRTGFQGIQTTTSVIHSDQGWGCLLRTSQMLLVHFLQQYVLPPAPDTAAAATEPLLRLFFDELSDAAPFSIHNMIASVWDRKAFRAEYWSPSQGCEAIRRTMAAAARSGVLPKRVDVVSSSNACLVAEDVVLALRGDADVVLLLTPVRVGVTSQLTQESYLQLGEVMSHPTCLGIVGGIPGRSYYFFGHSQTQLLYLDPHQHTQPALVSTREDQRGAVVPSLADVRCVDWSRVDTSLFLAFGLRTVAEWAHLRGHLAQVRFLCIEERRSLSDYAMHKEQRHRGKAFMSPLHSSGVGISQRERPMCVTVGSGGQLGDGPHCIEEKGSFVREESAAGETDSWEIMSDLECSQRY